MTKDISPAVLHWTGCWSHSIVGAFSWDAAGLNVSVRRLSWRWTTPVSQRLPGFGSGEWDGSVLSWWRALKLGFHIFGKGQRLLEGGGASLGLLLPGWLCIQLASALISVLFFLHQTFSFSFRTVLGAHHTRDTVGGQSNPT